MISPWNNPEISVQNNLDPLRPSINDTLFLSNVWILVRTDVSNNEAYNPEPDM